MEEEKEWTSLVGCVKKEGMANEQKFILLTVRPNDRIFVKGLSDQEVTEKLTLGIYNVATKQKNPKLTIRSIIKALEVLENELR